MTPQEYDPIIRRKASWIKWDEPVKAFDGWGCRLCIGRLGLITERLKDSPAFFKSLADFREHLQEVHGVIKSEGETQHDYLLDK